MKREKQLLVRISDADKERIQAKMKEAGILNMSAYVRKMALDGICVKLDLEEVRQLITIHKATKEAFEQLGLKKLPRVKELNAEYAQLLEQKKAAYPAYRKARAEMQEYLVAQKVAAVLLEKEKEQEAVEERRKQEQRTDQHR